MHEACEMHGIICGYELDWCACVVLACETNEMVGNQEAWYWYKRKPYTHGLGITSWYWFNMWYEWGLVMDVGM